MLLRFKGILQALSVLIVVLQYSCLGYSGVDLFVTGGMGSAVIDDHNTLLYQFKPDVINFSGLLGGGLQTDLTSSSSVGVGVRYIYNNIDGDVDPNINTDTDYSNKIDNILTTLEGKIDLLNINQCDLIFGTKAGLGINTYQMDLNANNVGGFGTKIDPEKKWKSRAAGFLGFYLLKRLDQDDIMLSLDYFYLGKMQSEKKSRSFPSNNLIKRASFHNKNVVLSITYFFKGLI